jgi:hypothetical protein
MKTACRLTSRFCLASLPNDAITQTLFRFPKNVKNEFVMEFHLISLPLHFLLK